MSRVEPRHVYVLSFDDANTDLKYIASHPDIGLDGIADADIFYGDIKNASTYSQGLNPIRANASIGSISFTFIDDSRAFTSLLNSKLLAGDGLRTKRVQHWIGSPGDTWPTDFTLIQTHQIYDSIQIVDDGLGYRFTARDIQRSQLKNIFEPKKTNTTGELTKTGITVNVSGTTGIDLLQHGSSYSDAPNAKVLYVRVRDEVIRCTAKTSTTFTVDNAQSTLNGAVAKDAVSIVVTDASGFDSVGVGYIDNGAGTLLEIKWTGKSSNTLTGVTGVTTAQTSGWTIVASNGRGALGTIPAAYKYDAGAADRVKVTEHIYYELPALKMAYAILTGTLYGSADTLPAHHHLGISTDWISTSQFIQFSEDLWDTSDDTQGVVLRFNGLKKTNAKKFIEEELYFWCGVFSPILNTGELGLKRMTGVLSDAAHTGIWDEDNVVSISSVKFDLNGIHNSVSIAWNQDPIADVFTRIADLTDSDSSGRWGESKTLELKSKGLHGSRHTDAVLGSMFNTWRDRHAGPPFMATVVLDYTQRDTKVGDIKRLKLGHLPEFTDQDGNYASVDMSVEVQRIRFNPQNGTVSCEVFGSTQKAAPLLLGRDDASPVADSWFTSEGSDISGATTGTLSGGGTIWTIDSASSLTGIDDLSSAPALADNDTGVFYWDGDLNVSALVDITKNIELRVNGFVTFNSAGKIDGKGAGLAGGTTGIAGGIGNTRAGGGIILSRFDFDSGYHRRFACTQSPLVEGAETKIPNYILVNDSGNALRGRPTNLQGSSGGKGGDLYKMQTTLERTGTQGANGGAGLTIYCKGASGVPGSIIDLSGDDSVAGTIHTKWEDAYAGTGAAGAAGGFAMFLIGNTVTETLSDYFVAVNGTSPVPGNPIATESGGEYDFAARLPWYSYFVGLTGGEDKSRANLLVDWVPDNLTVTADATPIAETGTLITFTENSNVPQTPAENLATIDINITPPSDTSYSHSMVEYKVTTDADTQYQRLPYPAKSETTVTVAMDGTEYTFRAYPVNIDGVESTDFIQKNFTVSNALSNVVLASGNFIATNADVSSNGGTQQDADGFSAFDSSGNQTFDVNANTGRVTSGDTTTEKYIDFNPATGDFEFGRDVQLRGADTYNNENIFFHSFFETVDSWAINTSSSAFATLNNLGFHLQVSGSNVENSRATYYLGRPLVTPVWSKNQLFKAVINSQNSASGTLYLVRGTATAKRFGFKAVGTTLYGVSRDTGSETLVNLSTTLTSTDVKLEAILTVGTNIEFFVNDVSKGTISTNLPTGGALQGAEKIEINLTKTAPVGTSDFFIDEIKILQEF